MSTTALHIIELVRSLPFEEQQAVAAALSRELPPPARVNFSGLDAAHSLHGRFAGGNMLDHLLRERAADRSADLHSIQP